MSWLENHQKSEQCSAVAHSFVAKQELDRARELFAEAAEHELRALECVPVDKHKTVAATALSAAALLYKARRLDEAEAIAASYLGRNLPSNYYKERLREVLNLVWTARSMSDQNLMKRDESLLFRFSGGRATRSGAPFDAIMGRCKTIVSIYYRVAEAQAELKYRNRGPAPDWIRNAREPVIHAAPAASFQCVLDFRRVEQQQVLPGMTPDAEKKLEEAPRLLFSSLRAASLGSDQDLQSLIPDPQYRRTFLKLFTQLCPDGKRIETIECRFANDELSPSVQMHKATKAEVRSVLSSQFPAVQPTGDSEPVKVTGTLRAINLEEGVIQVRTSDTETIRVSGLKGEAEDVIGPLLNRSVVVDTMKQGSSYSYVDIDATED